MKGKTIIILLIYMILVYTTFNVFTVVAYSDANEFNVGGQHDEIFDKGEVDWQIIAVGLLTQENVTGSDAWDLMNATFGGYKGHYFLFNWLDTGWYHVWYNNGDEIKVADWKFAKILAGTLDFDDNTWQEQAGSIAGSIWNSLGYVVGLLTFNVVNPVMADGSELPLWLTWIPLIMVLIPWVIIVIWLLPYIIEFLKAIGGLIPLT